MEKGKGVGGGEALGQSKGMEVPSGTKLRTFRHVVRDCKGNKEELEEVGGKKRQLEGRDMEVGLAGKKVKTGGEEASKYTTAAENEMARSWLSQSCLDK